MDSARTDFHYWKPCQNKLAWRRSRKTLDWIIQNNLIIHLLANLFLMHRVGVSNSKDCSFCQWKRWIINLVWVVNLNTLPAIFMSSGYCAFGASCDCNRVVVGRRICIIFVGSAQPQCHHSGDYTKQESTWSILSKRGKGSLKRDPDWHSWAVVGKTCSFCGWTRGMAPETWTAGVLGREWGVMGLAHKLTSGWPRLSKERDPKPFPSRWHVLVSAPFPPSPLTSMPPSGCPHQIQVHLLFLQCLLYPRFSVSLLYCHYYSLYSLCFMTFSLCTQIPS